MPEGLTIEVIPSLADIPAADWDRLANPPGAAFNPFVTHAFFHALEASGSATAQTGWLGQHILLKEEGHIRAILPLYLKSHSQGEYVFDHAFAEAFARAGGRYYPKLQSAVPFTPVTGPRLLAGNAPDAPALKAALLKAALALAEKREASSVHLTFLPRADWEALGDGKTFLQRADTQFHWENRGYRDFSEFLATLSSNRRKNLRKERAAALSPGIQIEWVTGSDITEAHWDAFFAFYMDTGARKWGRPYLTRDFFSRIGQHLAPHILLILCKREGRYIAGALNLIGSDTLYGRNWGAIEHHDFLHFEACYYQAIDFAIARGLSRVEAGAQGEHKLARGYMPVATHSLHHFTHPGLMRAARDYLDAERAAVAEERGLLAEMGPFRQTQPENE